MPTRSLTVLAADSGGASASLAQRAQATEFILGCLCESRGANPFVCRRAAQLLDELDDEGTNRRLLERVVDPDRPSEERSCALVAWAARLEARNRFSEASAALEAAEQFTPEDPSVLLHRARVARKHGREEEADELYARVEARVGESGHPLARMARLGTALLATDPTRAIGTVLRECVRAGDHEAAAVAHEGRADARLDSGDVAGAVRDLLLAGARYEDPVDVGRVGHALADVLLSAERLDAATRVLEATAERGHPRQAEWARSRLLQVARLAGDQVGARRWSDSAPPALVTLLPGGSRAAARNVDTAWLDRALRRLERQAERPDA